MMKKNRSIKVVCKSGYQYKSTPAIVLKGQWLKELGFEIGDYVSISYGKHIYFMNYGYSVKYYIYRQEIGNPANLQKIEKEVRQSQPIFVRNGRIYYEEAGSYSGSYCCYIIDTDKFTMKEAETYNIYDVNDRQYDPVIGCPLTYYLTCGSSNGIFAIRTDYLATINNLSSPVVKTADKTMKVTYILQEQ